ncbi:hypothetical protein PVAG01_02868 [Phlyctema vagabunda]|uniref:Amidoligase enzyme n=1 Tax=Phlyctema vagabunda TaxID=108571 RepID=A0ABR4PRX2_9HELO
MQDRAMELGKEMEEASDTPTAASSSESRKPLTFGVELEFLLATLLDDAEDPHPSDPRTPYGISNEKPFSEAGYTKIQRHIARTLNEAGFDAITADQGSESSLQLLSKWVVTSDSSLCMVDTKYAWYAVELNSPAYYTCPESILIVQKVCALLKKTYRINHNNSSGLHVHVGDGFAGFSDTVTQNVAAMSWAFEDLLDQMHPKSRIDGNEMCPSTLDGSRMTDALLNEKIVQRNLNGAFDPAEMRKLKHEGIARIFAAPGIYQLSLLLVPCYGGRSSASLRNLTTNDTLERDRKTIEFRKHQGTLRPERVAHWIRFCVGLVDFAMEIPRPRLVEFVTSKIDDSGFGLVELLNSIGLPLQARYYGILARQKSEEVQVDPTGKKQPDDDPDFDTITHQGQHLFIIPTTDFWDDLMDEDFSLDEAEKAYEARWSEEETRPRGEDSMW